MSGARSCRGVEADTCDPRDDARQEGARRGLGGANKTQPRLIIDDGSGGVGRRRRTRATTIALDSMMTFRPILSSSQQRHLSPRLQ